MIRSDVNFVRSMPTLDGVHYSDRDDFAKIWSEVTCETKNEITLLLLAFEKRQTAWQQPLGPIFDKWPGSKQSVYFMTTSNSIPFRQVRLRHENALEKIIASSRYVFLTFTQPVCVPHSMLRGCRDAIFPAVYFLFYRIVLATASFVLERPLETRK